MWRRAIARVLAVLLLGAFASASMGEEQTGQPGKPDAASIVKRMKEALEPTRPSVRIMTLTVNSPRGSKVEWRLAQARANVNGVNWMLTVVLLPVSWGEGIALLDEDRPTTAAAEYVYLPAFRRVRKFTPLEAWEPFFGSDFSYQDFSFPRPGRHAQLIGMETHNGRECYRLEEGLAHNPYFTKVETWVSVDTGLPVEQDYYDLVGKLYKSERYEDIVTIQNVPTITKIVMKNLQMDGSSEIDVTHVKYDKEAPQKLFDPDNLPNAAADQFWKSAM